MIICSWCKQQIKPHTQAFVVRTVRYQGDVRFQFRYHANVCYEEYSKLVAASDVAAYGQIASGQEATDE